MCVQLPGVCTTQHISDTVGWSAQLLGVPLRAIGSVIGFMQPVPLVNFVAVRWVEVNEVGRAAAR